MFNNYYLVRIKGHDIKSFIRNLHKKRINLNELKIYDKEFYAKLNQKDFNKLMEIKTSYEIEVIKKYGVVHYKEVLKNNIIFITSIIISLIILLILENTIFDVEIVTSDSKIRKILNEELEKYDIEKCKMVKSYSRIQEIKSKIIENNKDNIEYIEIEKVGTKYVIRVEKRIINNLTKENKIRHVVASKNGIIKKIEANKGEILTKVNDYVAKGDILISGEIHKGEDILDNTSADGKIFAEVWYKVKVTIPIKYYEEKKTGKSENIISINILDYNLNLFEKEKYKDKKEKETILFSDFFDLFKISYKNLEELEVNDSVNLITSENIAVKYAREKIISKLTDEEYIISQKKLKTTLNESTIKVEVFFKVYENITDYKYYEVNKEANKETNKETNKGMWFDDRTSIW